MGLRTIRLIGLIVGAMVMWNESLLVESSSEEKQRIAIIPAEISIPLPYVYPEYVDPREDRKSTPAEPSTTQENPDKAEKTTSVSDIILKDVRQTMLISTPIENLADKNNSIKSIVGEKNQLPKSPMKIMIIRDDNERPIIADQMIISKTVEETRRPFEKKANKFGDRIKTSTSNPIEENLPKVTSISKCKNNFNETETMSSNNDLAICQNQVSTIKNANDAVNDIRNNNNVTTTRRPTSRSRKIVAVRRRRPNAENSKNKNRIVRRRKLKNVQSDHRMQQEKTVK